MEVHLPSKALRVHAGQIAFSGEESVAAKLRATANDKALNEVLDFQQKNTGLEWTTADWKKEFKIYGRQRIKAADFSDKTTPSDTRKWRNTEKAQGPSNRSN